MGNLPKTAQKILDENGEEVLRQAHRAEAARDFILMNTPCGRPLGAVICGLEDGGDPDSFCDRCTGMLDVLVVLTTHLEMQIPRDELH